MVQNNEITEDFLNNLDKDLKELYENPFIDLAEDEYDSVKDFFISLFKGHGINLNIKQKEAVLREDEVLKIVAGAGTGKSTTLVSKIKYLVDVKKIDSSKILCLSFSKKSVEDLEDKLTEIFSEEFVDKRIDLNTFHAFGLRYIEDEISDVIEEEDIKKIFKQFILKEITEDIHILERFKKHFPEIFNIKHKTSDEDKTDIYIKPKGTKDYDLDFETLKKGCVVNTLQELLIADFLFLNDIDFDFEPNYESKSTDETVKFDFCVKKGNKKIFISDCRLEYQNVGKNTIQPHNLSSEETIRFRQYFNLISKLKTDELKEDLIILNSFKDYFDLDSQDNDENFITILEDELEKRGFKFNNQKPSKYKIKKYLEDTKFFEDMESLRDYFLNFIQLFKQHNFPENQMDDFNGDSPREEFFLEMASKFYKYYQNKLEKENLADFNDMIVRGKKKIESKRRIHNTSYDYILVDEYQDISKIRYELLDTIKRVSGAKLVVVGDDYQSIYGFTGCEVKYFSYFEDCFDDYEVGEINLKRTYRFRDELIKISKDFVSVDKSLIEKDLEYADLKKELKELEKDLIIPDDNLNNDCEEGSIIIDETIENEENIYKPVEILKYSFDRHQRILIFRILKGLSCEYKKGNCGNKVMILSRYNNRLDELKLILDKFFNYKKSGLEVEFSTIHGAKGLEADNVIIMDFNNHRRGIPSKVPEEKLLRFVYPEDDIYIRTDQRDSEERRVFYVALSRTRNKVYLCTQFNKESQYYYDLLKYNKDLIKIRRFRPSSEYNPFRVQVAAILKKHWDKREKIKEFDYFCPKCDHKLALYDLDGEYVIACTDYDNDEGCNFYIKDIIRTREDFELNKCPKCKSGFLYSNVEGYNSTLIKRYCSNERCKNYKTKKDKKQNLDDEQSTLEISFR